MRRLTTIAIPIILAVPMMLGISCSDSKKSGEDMRSDHVPEVIIKKREDGTLSSVNQVDEMGRVHGIRVTYFSDGKTVYSKFAFNHGIKQGPSIRYYRNGQIFEHSSFENGKKHGLSRIYYKNGDLLAECEFENGLILPGLKEYDRDGTVVTSYPEIEFREINHLATRNRIDLEISCKTRVNGVKYFLLKQDNGKTGRTYLISENNAATMQYYVKPGDKLDEQISIMAEIPTELGNFQARVHNYHLLASNVKQD